MREVNAISISCYAQPSRAPRCSPVSTLTGDNGQRSRITRKRQERMKQPSVLQKGMGGLRRKEVVESGIRVVEEGRVQEQLAGLNTQETLRRVVVTKGSMSVYQWECPSGCP